MVYCFVICSCEIIYRMGRKKISGNFGRFIIKDCFGKWNVVKSDDFFFYISEFKDGYDWGRLNF